MLRLSGIVCLLFTLSCGQDSLTRQPGTLIAPDEVDFGTVSIGIGAQRALTLDAGPRGEVTVTDVTAEHPELAILDAELPVTLGPDGELMVTVRWAPTAVGPHTGVVSFISDALNAERIDIPTRGIATSTQSCDDGNPCTVGQWDPNAGQCRMVEDQSLPGCSVSCPPGSLVSEPPFAGQWFEEIWSGSPTDIWAVGADGAAVHGNGSGWSLIDTCTPGTLFSVWGFAPNDVWAVGQDATALRWNGVSWEPEAIPNAAGTLWSVWGLSADDLWVVGDSGVAHHRTAQGWSSVNTSTSERLYSIWGSASDDIWAVGDAGVVLHWDGTGWGTVPTPAVDNFFSVRGSAADRAWAVGQSGMLLTWDGVQWSTTNSQTTTTLFAVWGAAADDYWVSGEFGTLRHYAGGTWTDHSLSSASRVYGLYGLASDQVWAAGSLGGVRVWDGTSWSVAQ